MQELFVQVYAKRIPGVVPQGSRPSPLCGIWIILDAEAESVVPEGLARTPGQEQNRGVGLFVPPDYRIAYRLGAVLDE